MRGWVCDSGPDLEPVGAMGRLSCGGPKSQYNDLHESDTAHFRSKLNFRNAGSGEAPLNPIKPINLFSTPRVSVHFPPNLVTFLESYSGVSVKMYTELQPCLKRRVFLYILIPSILSNF